VFCFFQGDLLMSSDRLTTSSFGPYVVFNAAVAAGADKTSTAIACAEIEKGCASISIDGGASASAASSVKLQASLNGVDGWYDTSTNHAVSVASNDWNSGSNGFTAGFGFADVNAPHIRLYLDSGTASAATTVTLTLWGKN
jgi:hypothetical protein